MYNVSYKQVLHSEIQSLWQDGGPVGRSLVWPLHSDFGCSSWVIAGLQERGRKGVISLGLFSPIYKLETEAQKG